MNQYFLKIGKEILAAREKRYLIKVDMSEKYGCIIELSLNIPGVPKQGSEWKKVFMLCVKYIQSEIPSKLLICDADSAGYYAIFSSYISLKETKIKSCLIEEKNEWGRLVDIDCSQNGKKISRRDLGFPERKCIICNKDNSECIGNHAHSIKELRHKAMKIARSI